MRAVDGWPPAPLEVEHLQKLATMVSNGLTVYDMVKYCGLDMKLLLEQLGYRYSCLPDFRGRGMHVKRLVGFALKN